MSARHEFVDQTEILNPAKLPWGRATGSEAGKKEFEVDLSQDTSQRLVFRRGDHGGQSVAERLFDATAGAKIWTSQVSMRLDRAVRDRLFRQLDNLHDEDDWFEDDKPVDLESFKSFVRTILVGAIGGKPGLSLTPEGYLVALWDDEQDSLAVEFRPKDVIRYIWSQKIDGEIERAAGTTLPHRLRDVLSPLKTRLWAGGS